MEHTVFFQTELMSTVVVLRYILLALYSVVRQPWCVGVCWYCGMVCVGALGWCVLVLWDGV